ncbi:MoxR family ATPase [Pseudonocardia petroleophila]|uniref:MoxR family ATPase n=1 Tax=Pseudonocardia petroleophila TaxID=37331 RepID=A0A7G7MJN2_9PSEU|nr:MoxR family ATPase [Pseudonocardia petroleophila]QNG52993.1 MoxR family ATPase [Pseudonocardia petroleophila]
MNAPFDPGAAYRAIADNVQQIVQGKPEVVRLAIVALFAEGHILLEDVPGLGKTTLAHCIARSIAGGFNRIQFTPDLLPGDITGSMVYHQADGRLDFRPGAVFTNVLVADEINRGTPKTQSALLEVMAEGRVTVDATSHPVPHPFIVVATQNPIELEGTYRLPEAQLDRFLVRLKVDYPDHDAELAVVMGNAAGHHPEQLQPVIDIATLQQVLMAVRQTFVDPQVASYAIRLAAATRTHPAIRYGASPRGSIGIVRAARALAATQSRAFVTPDDVKAVAPAVLTHRLVLTPDAELNRYTGTQVVREVLETVAAPGLLPSGATTIGPGMSPGMSTISPPPR